MKLPRTHSAIAMSGLLVLAAAISLPAEQPAPLPFLKGVTVSCQTWGIEWQTPEMEATLDELKSLGVNSIAIHPYAQVREDGHVVIGRRSSTSTTPSAVFPRTRILSTLASVRTSTPASRAAPAMAAEIAPVPPRASPHDLKAPSISPM